MEVGPKLCPLVMTKKFIFMTVQFKCLDSDASVNSCGSFKDCYCPMLFFSMKKAFHTELQNQIYLILILFSMRESLTFLK